MNKHRVALILAARSETYLEEKGPSREADRSCLLVVEKSLA